MPRPSLKKERRTEILDAYGRCIARYGVEGATLEKTAMEAGLARALIRHNVGNKDEMFESFVNRFLDNAYQFADAFFESLPQDERLATMIDSLFDPDYADAHDVSVTNALLIAAIRNRVLAKRLRQWIYEFVARLEAELRAAYPEADLASTEAVAAGIAGIYFNADTLTPLGGMSKLSDSSRTAARLLISTLVDPA